MGSTEVKRKYLIEHEQAIKDAEKAYLEALVELQENCPHDVILEHIDSDYEMFRVCEECGTTCRAQWSSPVHAFGNMEIFEGRAYKVSWPEFAKTTPKIGRRWVQREDGKFRRGGKQRG